MSMQDVRACVRACVRRQLRRAWHVGESEEKTTSCRGKAKGGTIIHQFEGKNAVVSRGSGMRNQVVILKTSGKRRLRARENRRLGYVGKVMRRI